MRWAFYKDDLAILLKTGKECIQVVIEVIQSGDSDDPNQDNDKGDLK